MTTHEMMNLMKNYGLLVDDYKEEKEKNFQILKGDYNYNIEVEFIHYCKDDIKYFEAAYPAGNSEEETTMRRVAIMNLANKGLDYRDFDNYDYGINKLSVEKGYNAAALESIVFTFLIKNVSLSMTHQLVRHRFMGFSQQSMRATDMRGKAMFRIPETLSGEYEDEMIDIIEQCYNLYHKMVSEGIPFQDARFILPSITTDIAVTGNYRAWQDFYAQRGCINVQWEINYVAEEIKKHISKVSQILGNGLKKGCERAKRCVYTSNMFPPCRDEDRVEGIDYIYPREMNPNYIRMMKGIKA